jgi:hypothetical protein
MILFRLIAICWLIVLVDTDPQMALIVAVVIGIVGAITGTIKGLQDLKEYEQADRDR